ncbi:hypothetical protein HDV00_003388 [Rhizophlyctis rosea]|nr:hypothetical protein HDV00_003388 [Rhizophlyctis rosea]
MSVIDLSGRAKVLNSIAFETVCKCLDGLCRPFSIDKTTHGGSFDIYPELYITIIADCGTTYFRSGQYPRAANYSKTFPMRVLLQDVVLTRDNLMAVAERLYDAINAYEDEFVVQRQKDTEAAAAIAYLPPNITPDERTSGSYHMADSQDPAKEGIFRTINHGLLALDQLPKDALPVMVLVTDGVVSDASTADPLAHSVFCRMVKNHVIFTVLQTGSTNGFTPTVNYGHVPDNEFLRFIASATYGKILYSSDCKYLEADASQPVPTEALPPNFYHRQLLFRERSFVKVNSEALYRLTHDGGIQRPVDIPRVKLLNTGAEGGFAEFGAGEVRFPWEPNSRPPVVAEILCGYREYTVSTPVQHIVSARLNEGFSLRSINLSRRPNRPDKVEIILSLPWLTNVTIFYTIKTTWVDKSREILSGAAPGKVPRVELNVLANHGFAIFFINVGGFESGIGRGGSQQGVLGKMQEKLGKLHAVLKGIFEGDEVFKVLTSFNTKYALQSIPQLDPRSFVSFTDSQSLSRSSSQTTDQSNYWHILAQIITARAESFPEWECDVILRSTSGFSGVAGVGGGGGRNEGRGGGGGRRQVAMMLLGQWCAGWSGFAVGRGVWIKFLEGGGEAVERDGDGNGQQRPKGFLLLRLVMENDCVATLKVVFFNASLGERKSVISDIVKGVAGVEHSVRGSAVKFRPLVVVRGEVGKRVVRWVFREGDDEDEEEDDDESVYGDETSAGRSWKTRRAFRNAECIAPPFVRSFLRQRRWVWLADVDRVPSPSRPSGAVSRGIAGGKRAGEKGGGTGHRRLPLSELVFLVMYRCRLEEGFLLVGEGEGSVTLFKEILVPRSRRLKGKDGSEGDGASTVDEEEVEKKHLRHVADSVSCGVQVCLILDRRTGTVAAEIWCEAVIAGIGGAAVDLRGLEEADWSVVTAFREVFQDVYERVLASDKGLVGRCVSWEKVWERGRWGGSGTVSGDDGGIGGLIGSPNDSSNSEDGQGMGNVVETEYGVGGLLENAGFVMVAYEFLDVVGGEVKEVVAAMKESGTSAAGPGLGEGLPLQRTNTTGSATGGSGWVGPRPAVGESGMSTPTRVGPGVATERQDNGSGIGGPPAMLRASTSFYSRGSSLNVNLKNPAPGMSGALSAGDLTSSMGVNVVPESAKGSFIDTTYGAGWEKVYGLDSVIAARTRRERVDAMVWWFLSQGVCAVTDAEIESSASADEKGNVLEEVCGKVCDVLGKERKLLMRDVVGCRCFVKVKDDESFLLIFVPRCNMGGADVGGGGEVIGTSAIGITIFECFRMAPSAWTGPAAMKAFEPADKDARMQRGSGEVEVVDAEGLDGVSGTFVAYRRSSRSTLELSPTSTTSRFDVGTCLSEFGQTFLSVLNGTFATAFAKSVYASLLLGQEVVSADFARALDGCVESSIDLDVTQYLNLRWLGGDWDGLWDEGEVQERFKEIIGEAFEEVAGLVDEDGRGNVYFYRPKDLVASDGGGELTAEKLVRVLGCAESPLFVRTECSFRKSNVYDVEHTQIPVVGLPKGYCVSRERGSGGTRKGSNAPSNDGEHDREKEGKSGDGNEEVSSGGGEEPEVDFTPSGVGTESNPIESMDGTRAILHVICMTVPNGNTVGGGIGVGSELEDGFGSGTPGEEWEPTLSRQSSAVDLKDDIVADVEKRAALDILRKKLETLIEDEVLHGLLYLKPVQDGTVRVVERILGERHMYPLKLGDVTPPGAKEGKAGSALFVAEQVGCSLGVNLPLHFVKSGMDEAVFLEEFRKMVLNGYRIVQAGEGYYIQVANSETDESGDEIAAGGEGGTSSDPTMTREQSFWLIVTASGAAVQMRFFSKVLGALERLGIIREIRRAVTECCERVNRLALLQDLNETHVASRYLISPAPSVEEIKTEETDDDGLSSPGSPRSITFEEETGFQTRQGFSAGRFSCPIVFQHVFPVHWRLKPLQALNHVVGSLQPMAISNRRDMFVFAQKEKVFYMRLGIEEVEVEGTRGEEGEDVGGKAGDAGLFLEEKIADAVTVSVQTEEKGKSSTNSPGGKQQREKDVKHAPASSTTVQAAASGIPHNVQTSASTASRTEHAIILEVRGVDSPGPEITEEFVALIDSKLNVITQFVVSTFLARNVTLKLGGADVDFVLPVARRVAPVRQEWLMVPRVVRSGYIFLLLLKQNLLTYMHSLTGVEVANALRRHYERGFGWGRRVSDVQHQGRGAANATHEVQIGDFAFLYNCLPTRNPSVVEAAVGQGIACVCFALVDSEGHVVLEADGETVDGCPGEVVSREEIIDSTRCVERLSSFEDTKGKEGTRVVIEVWTQGSVNVDGLFDQLAATFRDTLTDYVIEASIGKLVHGMQQKGVAMSDYFSEGMGGAYGGSEPTSPAVQDEIVGKEEVPAAGAAGAVDEEDTIGENVGEFYETVLETLKRAVAEKNPIVQELTSPVRLGMWKMEDFAAEVQELLMETSPLLAPVVLRKKNDQDGPLRFEVHKSKGKGGDASGSMESLDHVDKASGMNLFLIVSGLHSLNARYGLWRPMMINRERQSSFGSDSSSFITMPAGAASAAPVPAVTGAGVAPNIIQSHVRRSSVEDSASETTTNASGGLRLHNRRASRASGGADASVTWGKSQMDQVMYYAGGLHPTSVDIGGRSCFLLIAIEGATVTTFTYNWNRGYVEQVFGRMLRVLSWNNIRMQFLEKEGWNEREIGGATAMGGGVGGFEVGSTPAHMLVGSYGGEMFGARAMAEHFAGRTFTPKPMLQPVGEDVTQDSAENRTKGYQQVNFRTDTDVLQKHAVEFLDAFVRQVGVGGGPNVVANKGHTEQGGGVRGVHLKRKLADMGPGHVGESGEKADKGADKPSVSASELAGIIRTVRLLHFVRYPLLFSEMKEQLVGFDKIFGSTESAQKFMVSPGGADAQSPVAGAQQGSSSDRDDNVLRWHKDMVDTFIKECVGYLTHLGLEVVAREKMEGGEAASHISQYQAGPNLVVDTGVVYLKKVFEGGYVIAQVGVDGPFACVNLYTLKVPVKGRRGSNASRTSVEGEEKQKEKEDEKSIGVECHRLKNQIHINSFVYDFHIRHFQRMLDRKVKEQHGPNLLTVIQSFTRFNPRHATFARCRIYHGQRTNEGTNISTSLFQYILKNPQRYGFLPVKSGGQPVACYVSSDMPDFMRGGVRRAASGGTTDWTYTIVVCQPNGAVVPLEAGLEHSTSDAQLNVDVGRESVAGGGNEKVKLTLEYYVMVVYRKDAAAVPYMEMEARGGGGLSMAKGGWDVLGEYLGGGYYLKDVVKNAEREIDRMVHKAVRFYGRDSLWRQLIKSDGTMSLSPHPIRSSPPAPGASVSVAEGIQEWTKLFLEKIAPNSRSVTSIDPDLERLFSDVTIPWNDVIDFLKEGFGSGARELVDSSIGGKRHLVVFNPRDQDYLLHFVVWRGSGNDVPAAGAGGSNNSGGTVTGDAASEVTMPSAEDSMVLRDDSSEVPGRASTSTRAEAESASVTSPVSVVSPVAIRVVEGSRREPREGEWGCEVFAVSREGTPSETEGEHIADVVNRVLAWLWKRVAIGVGIL